jgi:hypothetical protein
MNFPRFYVYVAYGVNSSFAAAVVETPALPTLSFFLSLSWTKSHNIDEVQRSRMTRSGVLSSLGLKLRPLSSSGGMPFGCT